MDESISNALGGEMDEEGLENDPVVRELNVYLSNQLSQQLHVIQYPNRPFYRPYDPPVNARVKPNNKLLELEYDLPKCGEHIDEDAPRHLRLDRIKVQSSYLDPMTTYAIGAIHSNELHLTPLCGVFQMRSSCEHVDAAGDPDLDVMDGDEEDSENEVEATTSSKGGKFGGAAASGSSTPAPPVRLQHIEYKKKESEKAAAARRNSYAYKRQQEEAERWTELAVHGFDTEECQEDYDRLFCTEPDREIKFKGGKGVYAAMYRTEMAKALSEDRTGRGNLKAMPPPAGVINLDDKAAILAGAVGGQQTATGTTTANGPLPSIQQLRGAEQVAAILDRAEIVSLNQILELVGSQRADAVGVLEYVKRSAVLLRGNWVRKSSLYSLPPKLMEARDALLLLLERYGGINRLQVSQALNLQGEEVMSLLQGFAVLEKEKRMWMSKLPDNVEFVSKYPEVVTQQSRLWREKEKELQSIIGVIGQPDCPFPGPLVVPFIEPSSAAGVASGGKGGGIMGRGGSDGSRSRGGCVDEGGGGGASPMDAVVGDAVGSNGGSSSRRASSNSNSSGVLAPGQKATPTAIKSSAGKFKPKGGRGK